jgi:hypothetical protein
MQITIHTLSKELKAAKAQIQPLDITADDIQELDSFRGLSGEQAQHLAATLKTFTEVVFMACTNRKTA